MSAPISPEAEDILRRAYVELKTIHASISAQTLLTRANTILAAIEKKDGPQDIRLPKLRKTGYILQTLKDKDKKRPERQKALDWSWTLRSLADNPISPEAMPVVLRVWAQIHVETQQTYYPFTVRVAQWVARLYKVFEHDGTIDLDGLIHVSYIQADQEKVEELTEVETDQPREHGTDGMAMLTWVEERATRRIWFLCYLSHMCPTNQRDFYEKQTTALWVERYWKTIKGIKEKKREMGQEIGGILEHY